MSRQGMRHPVGIKDVPILDEGAESGVLLRARDAIGLGQGAAGDDRGRGDQRERFALQPWAGNKWEIRSPEMARKVANGSEEVAESPRQAATMNAGG